MSEPDTATAVDERPTGRRYTIIVNSRPKHVDDRELTFTQIVALAFGDGTDADVTFTVTYHRAAGARREGTLSEGGTVTIKDGTIFDVTRTRRS
ncbi:multiubiquitin domain-containing protein [Actinoplanes sp. NPDC026670]|uniref:multiubiquitin domain-containing protein n=1 Tax=Actinoplanes sp. NPDC026670 TaxID=3154700 RepID=UPI0033E32222